MPRRTLNRVELIGRLGQDPELQYTQGGKRLTRFSLATNRYLSAAEGQPPIEETEWHQIVAWDKLAETCSKFLRKGSYIRIEGRIQTRSWDDVESGQKRYRTEVIARDMMMLDSAPDHASGDNPSYEPGSSNEATGDEEFDDIPYLARSSRDCRAPPPTTQPENKAADIVAARRLPTLIVETRNTIFERS